jgi:uncharacterized protein (TIGR02118 family)
MIKLVFALRRKPELSLDEFQDYWRNTHAPLVAERAEVLNIRRYVQVHTLDQAGLHGAFQRRNGGAPAAFDGVAELWFDSLESFGGGDDPAVRQAQAELLEDEAKFIDLPNSPMWVASEFEVVAGSNDA